MHFMPIPSQYPIPCASFMQLTSTNKHQHLLLFSAKILIIAITSQDEQFFMFNQPHSDAN